jgi:hypothetical protein
LGGSALATTIAAENANNLSTVESQIALNEQEINQDNMGASTSRVKTSRAVITRDIAWQWERPVQRDPLYPCQIQGKLRLIRLWFFSSLSLSPIALKRILMGSRLF